MPRYFSWVVPFFFAVMSTPRNEDDIVALEHLGFNIIVTLTEEYPLPTCWFQGRYIRNVFVPIKDKTAPSINEVDAASLRRGERQSRDYRCLLLGIV